MSFLSSIFLWAGLSVVVPILIALWNRKRFQREAFGGYYLLKRILETTRRRIRILEILKLLNRIALFSLLVLVFADPFRMERRLGNASDGFALLIDAGRVMQSPADTGWSLAEEASRRAVDLLKKLPDHAQGTIFFVSDRCDSAPIFETRRLTARASEWLSAWELNKLPFTGQPTTTEGLSQCLQKIRGIFGDQKIYSALISPMPSTFDKKFLETSSLQLESLAAKPLAGDRNIEIQQEVVGERIRIHVSPSASRKAAVIQGARVEDLGNLMDTVDLLASDQTFLWVRPADDVDPWVGHRVVSLNQSSSMKVTLWAERESPGYLSLLTALRNYSGLKVNRQIGGEPSGDSIIVYRSFKFDPSSLPRAWFFLDYEHPSSFGVRDQKQWVAGLELSDARKAFQMVTQDGSIFVKKYLILDLDRFETLESFDDGAPALLKDRNSRDRHWISPFDLEDLTTDLSLEPTFIPYLYRRLDRWLAVDQSTQSGEWQVLWTLAGATPPTKEVLARQAWPGIYIDPKSPGLFKIVEPAKLPESLLQVSNKGDELHWRDEKIFLKQTLLQLLAWSLCFELLLCLASVRWAWIGVWLFILSLSDTTQAANVTRPIQMGVLSSMDADRKTALQQILLEFEHMSNLTFEKPEEATPAKFWNYAAIVISSTHPFGPFKKEEREQIREYCERGGVLIFDDPLASADSEFYRSVKKELSQIFPGREMAAVSKDDVLFRTFYLLSEVSGRKLSSPYLEGISLDKRWVAIFSFNDVLGANLKSARGDYALSVSPYGISQRTLARRLWLNLMMYAVTLDYKDDAIHLPHILKKRVR